VSRILVVAPHPDDETLGCGGTILRHRAASDEVGWLIVTEMTADTGFTAERMQARAAEIEAVAAHYRIAWVDQLGLPTTRLDAIPRGDIIAAIAGIITERQPDTVFLPHPGDAHSDHTITFDACAACLKWTKAPSVRRIATYETLSETDLALPRRRAAFQPLYFVDIADHLDAKIVAMRLYASELGDFPFPRSEEAIRSLAKTRGAQAGFGAAEAFTILRERW